MMQHVETDPVFRDDRINEIITQLDIGALFKDLGDDLRDSLSRYSDSTLTLIEETTRWNIRNGNRRLKFMLAAVTETNEQLTRELMFFLPLLRTDLGTVETYEVVLGLHLLDRYKETERMDELTGDEKEAAAALLNVTAALYEYNPASHCLIFTEGHRDKEPTSHIKDPELQTLIAENWRHALSIIEYIEERGTADPAALREYLGNNTALMTGTL